MQNVEYEDLRRARRVNLSKCRVCGRNLAPGEQITCIACAAPDAVYEEAKKLAMDTFLKTDEPYRKCFQRIYRELKAKK